MDFTLSTTFSTWKNEKKNIAQSLLIWSNGTMLGALVMLICDPACDDQIEEATFAPLLAIIFHSLQAHSKLEIAADCCFNVLQHF